MYLIQAATPKVLLVRLCNAETGIWQQNQTKLTDNITGP